MAWLISAFFLKFLELLSPKHVTAFIDLPDELIVEVLASLEVTQILKTRQVCRRLDACTREMLLWRRVALRMAHDCALSALPSISRMSAKELEHLAIRRIRAKQRMEAGLSKRIELRSRQVPIRVSDCHLVPGGQWLIMSTWAHEIYCWNLDKSATKEPILLVRPDEAKDIKGRPFTAIDYHNSGKCTLVMARLRVDGYKIEVYSMDFTRPIPHMSILGTIAPPDEHGTVLISGPHITRIQNLKSPVIESFNWEQCISRKQFDYTAITCSLPPSRFLWPKQVLSNGLLICHTWREILVYRLSDFQPVSRLGEIDPTPTVPYWWYTPDDLKIPAWPSPASLSPSDAHLQPSDFVCSILLPSYPGHACRIYTQSEEPVIHRVPFDHSGDFVELGCDSGFRIWKRTISSLRVSDDSVTATEPVPLDMGQLMSRSFSSCRFDEFSGRSCFIRCGETNSWIALLDIVE